MTDSRGLLVRQNALGILQTPKYFEAGEHSVSLDIEGLASGSYLCRMVVKGKQVGRVGFVIGK